MSSTAGFLCLESALGQLIEQKLNMIALDFDDALLERAASTAATLEGAGKFLQFVFGKRYPGDRRHGLATAPLAFPADASDAVAFGYHGLLARTGVQRLTAIWAMPSCIGRKHQPAKA